MKAKYVSVWEGGIEVTTSCEYDVQTNEVYDIETSDVDGLDALEDEYILLPDGTEVRDFITEGNESESLTYEEIEFLKSLKL